MPAVEGTRNRKVPTLLQQAVTANRWGCKNSRPELRRFFSRGKLITRSLPAESNNDPHQKMPFGDDSASDNYLEIHPSQGISLISTYPSVEGLRGTICCPKLPTEMRSTVRRLAPDCRWIRMSRTFSSASGENARCVAQNRSDLCESLLGHAVVAA